MIKNVRMARERDPAKEERTVVQEASPVRGSAVRPTVSAATDGRGSVSGSYHKP